MATKFFTAIRARFFSTAADTALDVGVSGDTQPRLAVDAGGKLSWGSGTATADVNLYRDAADVLKTDDTLKANRVFVGNVEIDTAGATALQALSFDGTKFSPKTVRMGIKVPSGNAYTLVSADDLQMIELNTATSFSVVIPTNASVPFPVGAKIYVAQIGTGKTVIVGASTVTINGLKAQTTEGPYSVTTLVYRGSDSWLAYGTPIQEFAPIDLNPVLLLDPAQV